MKTETQKKQNEAQTKPSIWSRICNLFSNRFLSFDVASREEEWGNLNSNAGDLFEKHWRYSRQYRGFDRSLMMI
jgi:hypothetical protein